MFGNWLTYYLRIKKCHWTCFFISKVVIVHPKSCMFKERCLFQKWWFFTQDMFIHGGVVQTSFVTYKYLHKHSFQHTFYISIIILSLSFSSLWFMHVQEILEMQTWFFSYRHCILRITFPRVHLHHMRKLLF